MFLKLLEEDNTKAKQEEAGKAQYQHLDSFKEFDLIIMSVKPLETKNAKQLTSVNFLKNLQKQEDLMLGIILSKRQP